MNASLWRRCAVGIVSASLLNMGMMSAASAAIVDTAALVRADRDADLGAIRSQLSRAEVRAQLEAMGVDAVCGGAACALNESRVHRAGGHENARDGSMRCAGRAGSSCCVRMVG